MNLFLGTHSSTPAHEDFVRLQESATRVLRMQVAEDQPEGGTLRTGIHAVGGKALGQAQDGGCSTVLFGFLHLPVPDWNGNSPLDDPDGTAAWLLSRYRTMGTRFLDNVFGRFTVAVMDRDNDRLLLGSDPYGHCRVFYHENSERLAFCTHLYAMSKGLALQADRSYEDFFLLYGVYPGTRTSFAGVQYLSAKKLLVREQGTSRLEDIAAGDPWNTDAEALRSRELPEAELIELLHGAFMRALEEELSSERRAAVLLGGFDSALVVAGLKEMGKEVETYSFYYRDPRYNQAHTDTLARHLGVEHHWVEIDDRVVSNGLAKYERTFNTPTNWPYYVIQTQVLAETIRRDGFECCYSGDGCDGLFFGYPLTFKRSEVIRKIRLSPRLAAMLVRLLGIPALERLMGRPYIVALNLLRSWGRKYPERGYITFKVFDELSLGQLRLEPPPPQEQDVEQLLTDLAAPFAEMHPTRLAYTGKNVVSPAKIKMNGSTDTTGLVINSPYLHAGMMNLVQKLPEEVLRPAAQDQATVLGKHILMRMAETKGMLPHEVIYQQKFGAADVPLDEWYQGVLRPAIVEQCRHLPFRYSERYVRSLFNAPYAESVFGRMISKDTSNVVTFSHGLSLLATYAAFFRPDSAPGWEG